MPTKALFCTTIHMTHCNQACIALMFLKGTAVINDHVYQKTITLRKDSLHHFSSRFVICWLLIVGCCCHMFFTEQQLIWIHMSGYFILQAPKNNQKQLIVSLLCLLVEITVFLTLQVCVCILLWTSSINKKFNVKNIRLYKPLFNSFHYVFLREFRFWIQAFLLCTIFQSNTTQKHKKK